MGMAGPYRHPGQCPHWWGLSNDSRRKGLGSVTVCVPAEEASRGTPSFFKL